MHLSTDHGIPDLNLIPAHCGRKTSLSLQSPSFAPSKERQKLKHYLKTRCNNDNKTECLISKNESHDADSVKYLVLLKPQITMRFPI